MGERRAAVETRIEVSTAAKTGYARRDTDLTLPVGGSTVTVTRAYDSTAAGTAGSFGDGWRWALGDFLIRTNVPLDGRESYGVFEPFRDGTRLYLTVPSGERVGFTFTPEGVNTGGGLVLYRAKWTADAGNPYVLASAAPPLTKAGAKYYDLTTGQPYNPAGVFTRGPAYTLTAPTGETYELDGGGRATAVTLTGAGRVTLSGSAILGPDGAVLASFVRDAAGRVTAISARGGQTNYEYDAAGRLVAVRDGSATARAVYGYDAAGRLRVGAVGGQGRPSPTGRRWRPTSAGR